MYVSSSRSHTKGSTSFRFLYREDPASEIAVYQYVRHIFGFKDSPSCANYALKRCGSDNRNTFPEAAESVQRVFLHGRLLEVKRHSRRGQSQSKGLDHTAGKGGFILTKFVSNINHLPTELQNNGEPAPTNEKVIPNPDESSHVLGPEWNHVSETLVVSRGTSLDTNKTNTQRVVLSLV